jgi:hypothetical protein
VRLTRDMTQSDLYQRQVCMSIYLLEGSDYTRFLTRVLIPCAVHDSKSTPASCLN